MEWKEYNICQLCDTISETYKGKSNSVVLINTSDVLEGKVLNHKRVPNKGLKGQFKKTFKKNDILYSEIRPANKRFAYINFSPNDYIASTKLMVLRSKPIVSSYFLFQILKSEIVLKNLQMLAESRSGTFPQITYSELSNVRVKVPPLPVQDKIVGILSALDSKIENNNKINGNLEAQAQALFKSWFVDFTPFKDQPFVDSELGPIPQGWKVGKLGDYVEIKRGGSPRPIQKFLASQGLNWLKISDATSTQSPFIFNIKEKIIIDGLKKTVFLKAGSLVLSNSATPCIPKFLSIDSCIHDGWLYFPHSQLPENYLYLFFKLMRNNLVSKANGSVFLNLKTDIVKNQVFAFSGEEIYNSFDKIIAPLFKEIENLTYETFQLSALRDTLLPKLMSGEIKL